MRTSYTLSELKEAKRIIRWTYSINDKSPPEGSRLERKARHYLLELRKRMEVIERFAKNISEQNERLVEQFR